VWRGSRVAKGNRL